VKGFSTLLTWGYSGRAEVRFGTIFLGMYTITRMMHRLEEVLVKLGSNWELMGWVFDVFIWLDFTIMS
jgi:hypothetical protein